MHGHSSWVKFAQEAVNDSVQPAVGAFSTIGCCDRLLAMVFLLDGAAMCRPAWQRW
jgi:hypothetical protein